MVHLIGCPQGKCHEWPCIMWWYKKYIQNYPITTKSNSPNVTDLLTNGQCPTQYLGRLCLDVGGHVFP
jgi:hypothetical protein